MSDNAELPVTLFCCGPSRCEHDYSGWKEYEAEGGGWIGTAVCVKCKAEAINEAAWLWAITQN